MQSLLLYAPLVIANLWHAYLVFRIRPRHRGINSISETAHVSRNVLTVHRVVHVAVALCFITFAVASTTGGDFSLAMGLLILAAVFDILQVSFLNSETNHSPFALTDLHQVFAWLMSLGYLGFAISYAIEQHVPAAYLLIFGLVLGLATIGNYYSRHRYYWMTQMIFFVSVAMLVYVSGLRM